MVYSAERPSIISNGVNPVGNFLLFAIEKESIII